MREPKTGWIVEIQIIPAQMYAVKNSCGHAGYAKYRFILEACKRAHTLEASKQAKLKKEAIERAKLKFVDVGEQDELTLLSESLGIGAITNVSQC